MDDQQLDEYLRDIRHLLYVSAVQQSLTNQAILAGLLPDDPDRDALATKLARQTVDILSVLSGIGDHIPEARHG